MDLNNEKKAIIELQVICKSFSVGKRKAEFEIAVSKQRRRGGSFEKANRANGKSGKECGDFYYG